MDTSFGTIIYENIYTFAEIINLISYSSRFQRRRRDHFGSVAKLKLKTEMSIDYRDVNHLLFSGDKIRNSSGRH